MNVASGHQHHWGSGGPEEVHGLHGQCRSPVAHLPAYTAFHSSGGMNHAPYLLPPRVGLVPGLPGGGRPAPLLPAFLLLRLLLFSSLLFTEACVRCFSQRPSSKASSAKYRCEFFLPIDNDIVRVTGGVLSTCNYDIICLQGRYSPSPSKRSPLEVHTFFPKPAG